jgi:hypothetical protein
MGETIRLEEFTGLIQNKVVAVWQTPDAVEPWLPTEFMLSQYITRILITGRTAAMSTALVADQSWTQVWRSPGGKEWSCLLGILQHMPGPVLIIIGPDVVLTPKLVTSLQAAARSGTPASVFVLRQAGVAGWAGPAADHVFFPVLETGARYAGLMAALQEWVGHAMPRTLDFKTLLPQLAAAGYGLSVAEGLWHWYKPADSVPMATLTVAQIARQLHILGTVLEKAVV